MNPRCISAMLASIAVASSLRADTILEQPDTGLTGYASQDFPDFPTYSCSVFDDVTLTQAYNLTNLVVYGENRQFGGSAADIDVRLRIFTDANLLGTPIASVSGVDVDGVLSWNLAGITLGAGTYWLSAQVVRSFSEGDQWFWRASETVNGAHAMWHNPGGGFGHGTDPVSTEVLGSQYWDMALKLEGDPVPAPGVLAIVGIGGLFGGRRRGRSVQVDATR